jgi:hypothetical protein
MTDQKILDALQPVIQDNKLSCHDALAAAAKLDLKPSQIGKYCNQNRIQIVNCQLGCFGVKDKRSWAAE